MPLACKYLILNPFVWAFFSVRVCRVYVTRRVYVSVHVSVSSCACVPRACERVCSCARARARARVCVCASMCVTSVSRVCVRRAFVCVCVRACLSACVACVCVCARARACVSAVTEHQCH